MEQNLAWNFYLNVTSKYQLKSVILEILKKEQRKKTKKKTTD